MSSDDWKSLFPVLLLCDLLSQGELEWQWHCARFFLYCVRTVIVCVDFVVTNHGGCARTISSHWTTWSPISCENCFLSYGDFCVLYSGKSDFLLAFAQQHGVILTEILGKGGCGGKAPHLKGGLGAKPPSLEYILLCLNKVRKVRLLLQRGVWGTKPPSLEITKSVTGYVKWYKVRLVPNMFGFSYFWTIFHVWNLGSHFSIYRFLCVFTPILCLPFLNYTYLTFFSRCLF